MLVKIILFKIFYDNILDFIMKVYRNSPEFPNGGKFSQYFEKNLNVGDEIKLLGPFGNMKYEGWGVFKLKGVPLHEKKKVGLIAGGSGITPMLSIAQASLLADDGLEINFVYSNKTKDDILCKQ